MTKSDAIERLLDNSFTSPSGTAASPKVISGAWLDDADVPEAARQKVHQTPESSALQIQAGEQDSHAKEISSSLPAAHRHIVTVLWCGASMYRASGWLAGCVFVFAA